MTELADQIQDIVQKEPVALFMKGTPAFAACGNSQRALDALRSVGAPVAAVNILPDPADPRRAVGALTAGRRSAGLRRRRADGGADIVQELAESGDLSDVIGDKLGEGWQAPGNERVVPLEL